MTAQLERLAPIYAIVDGAAVDVMAAFWSAVAIVRDQASVMEADALQHMKRTIIAHVKAAKPSGLVDFKPDGRAATWRVRLTIWRGATASNLELVADTDAPAPYERPGAELIQGLPAVAQWAWELIGQAHPGATIKDLSLATMTARLRTLRVALSNQGGEVVWRHRYIVEPRAVETPEPSERRSLRDVANAGTRQPEVFLAIVRISQEAGTGRREK